MLAAPSHSLSASPHLPPLAHTVMSKMHSIPTVPRDDKGHPMLPLNVSIMTVVRLGELPSEEALPSACHPEAEVVYHCTILDGGNGPKFQIVADNIGAWSIVSATRLTPSFRIDSFEALNPPAQMFCIGGSQQPVHLNAPSEEMCEDDRGVAGRAHLANTTSLTQNCPLHCISTIHSSSYRCVHHCWTRLALPYPHPRVDMFGLASHRIGSPSIVNEQQALLGTPA
ncbi:hypothetical protein EW146_g7368 [Bondarzewia mesenterica]|uniref:Uncharacterized protein n=1 Tax=Bondarzewia mesenterica TaxID=1095465 RepID=A0A4S4LMU9_9AGAM|nr:hypothetical protein EW146_g7368 [Bondarzewia mesenterica]